MEDIYGTDAYNQAFGLDPLKYAKGNANGQIAKANTIGSLAGREAIVPTLTAFKAGINPSEIYARAGLQSAQGSYTGINNSWVPAGGASDSYAARNARIAALTAAGLSDSDARIEADNGFHIADSGDAPYAPLILNPPSTVATAQPAQANWNAATNGFQRQQQRPQGDGYYQATQAGAGRRRDAYGNPNATAATGSYQAPQVASTAVPTASTTATPVAAASTAPQSTGFRLPNTGYNAGFAKGVGFNNNNTSAYRRSLGYDR